MPPEVRFVKPEGSERRVFFQICSLYAAGKEDKQTKLRLTTLCSKETRQTWEVTMTAIGPTNKISVT
jgi:hypothetical protein